MEFAYVAIGFICLMHYAAMFLALAKALDQNKKMKVALKQAVDLLDKDKAIMEKGLECLQKSQNIIDAFEKQKPSIFDSKVPFIPIMKESKSKN